MFNAGAMVIFTACTQKYFRFGQKHFHKESDKCSVIGNRPLNLPPYLCCGTQLIKLRDLSNSSQLQIEGHLKIEEFLANQDVLIIPTGTLLDASKVISYDNQGSIIQNGQILYLPQIVDCFQNKV